MATSVWHLSAGWGRLAGVDWECAVEIAHPDRGLQHIRVDANEMSVVIPLRVSAEPPTPSGGEVVIENYVRGEDLVANYAQTPVRTARPQIYWRSVASDIGMSSPGGFAGVELWLSVQTTLLASNPVLSLSTQMRGGGELRAGRRRADGLWDWKSFPASSDGSGGLPGNWDCYVLRPDGSRFSYGEMIYPGDGGDSTWQRRSRHDDLLHRLFLQSLEKGVIRRGRVRGCFTLREQDELAVQACFQQMVEAPLPLTA